MLVILAGLGTITLITGYLLLFKFSTLKQISRKLDHAVFSEDWVYEHRTALGILLLGLTGFLFVGVYFMLKFGV